MCPKNSNFGRSPKEVPRSKKLCFKMYFALLLTIIIALGSCQNISDLCAQFTNTTNNEFTSPNYPGNYPENIQCIKLIEAPLNHVIRLHFLENFHIEYDVECRHDYIEIRDGQFGYSGLIGNKVCGTTPPSYIESSGMYLWLRFKSDGDISYIGFKIYVEFVPSSGVGLNGELPPPPTTCNFIHKSEISGTIKTSELETSLELVPEPYLDCTWIIEAEPDQKIFLQFPAYKLEKPNDCTFNFVEVYGSKTELDVEDGRLKQFCGSDKDSVTSRGNKLHLRFYSGFSYSGSERKLKSGFEAYFSVFRETKEGQQCNANTEFDCTDGTCIAFHLKCNGIANCKFRNDEDDRCNLKSTFELTTDILIIAFLGILLIAGMCSGLMLNVYRKLKQDKLERAESKKSTHSLAVNPPGNESQGNNKTPSKSPSTSNSEKSSKSTVIRIPYLPPKPYKRKEAEELLEMRDSTTQTISNNKPSPSTSNSADVLVWIK